MKAGPDRFHLDLVGPAGAPNGNRVEPHFPAAAANWKVGPATSSRVRFRAGGTRVSVNDMTDDIVRPFAGCEPPTPRLIDANALLVDLGTALTLVQHAGERRPRGGPTDGVGTGRT